MKKIKRALVLFLCMTMCVLTQINVPKVQASSGTFSVSGGGSVKVGDTVTVTVSLKGDAEIVTSQAFVNYDAGVLEYKSGAQSGGSGRLQLLKDYGTGVKSDSWTLTFTAKSVGSSNVSLENCRVINLDPDAAGGDDMSLSVGGAASVKVEEAVTKSADASIKSLTVSPGKLSPTFKSGTFKYTMSVENDVTSIAVSATPVNSAAKISSVTGNENLAVGKNTIKIVCTAENGGTATYTITVTRAAAQQEKPEETQEPEETNNTLTEEIKVTVGQEERIISDTFKDKEIPKGFERADVNYQGKTIKGIKFSKADVWLLYLVDADKKNGAFYLYNNEINEFNDLNRLAGNGEEYLILLNPDWDHAVPQEFYESPLTIEDKTFRAWQMKQENTETVTDETEQVVLEEETIEDVTLPDTTVHVEDITAAIGEFSYLYAVNQDGVKGWYSYDQALGSYQRFVDTGAKITQVVTETLADNSGELEVLRSEYDKDIKMYRIIILVLSVLVVLVVIVLIVKSVKNRRKYDDDEYDDGYEEEYEEYEPYHVQEKPAEPESGKEEAVAVEENIEEPAVQEEKQVQEEAATKEKEEEAKQEEEKKEEQEENLDDDFDFEFIDLDDDFE